jgi:hypothetical protein
MTVVAMISLKSAIRYCSFIFLITQGVCEHVRVNTRDNPAAETQSRMLRTRSSSQTTVVSAFYNLTGKHTGDEWNTWLPNFFRLNMSNVVIFSTGSGLTRMMSLWPPSATLRYINSPLQTSLFGQFNWTADEAMDHEKRTSLYLSTKSRDGILTIPRLLRG